MIKEKRAYDRIKAVLAEKGKTNLWLAASLKVNRTTVSKWCTNEVQSTMESLFRIAEALDVNIRKLLVSNRKSV